MLAGDFICGSSAIWGVQSRTLWKLRGKWRCCSLTWEKKTVWLLISYENLSLPLDLTKCVSQCLSKWWWLSNCWDTHTFSSVSHIFCVSVNILSRLLGKNKIQLSTEEARGFTSIWASFSTGLTDLLNWSKCCMFVDVSVITITQHNCRYVFVWVLQHLRRTAMKLWLSKRTQSPKPMISAPKICGERRDKEEILYKNETKNLCWCVLNWGICFYILRLSHLGLISRKLFCLSPLPDLFRWRGCGEKLETN